MQGYADLMHPLTKLVWEKNKETLYMAVYGRWIQCTVLREKIFITNEKLHLFDFNSFPDSLSAYYTPIADLGSWTPFSVPAVRGFALTTYHSQLVLVGGWTRGAVLNTLWASTDGANWQETLPPMPTSRYGAAAVNTGSSGGPECLVVAGGTKECGEKIDTVEVLTKGQWSTVSPLPEPYSWHRYFIFHNGGVYLGGPDMLFYCQLHSLLASDQQRLPWQRMPTPSDSVVTIVSFRGHLIFFGSNIYVYCPLQQSWVCVG